MAYRSWLTGLAAAAALALAGPTSATIYEQGAVSVTDGPTSVTVLSNVVNLPTDRTLYLTLDSGVLTGAMWGVDIVWAASWWEEFAPGQLWLSGNEYIMSPILIDADHQVAAFSPGHYFDATSTLTPALATFFLGDHSNSFFDCSDPYARPLGQHCAEFVFNLHDYLNQFTVLADRDFTWTLSDVAPVGVPEPTSWILLILGVGLGGAGLRARRRACARLPGV